MGNIATCVLLVAAALTTWRLVRLCAASNTFAPPGVHARPASGSLSLIGDLVCPRGTIASPSVDATATAHIEFPTAELVFVEAATHRRVLVLDLMVASVADHATRAGTGVVVVAPTDGHARRSLRKLQRLTDGRILRVRIAIGGSCASVELHHRDGRTRLDVVGAVLPSSAGGEALA